MYEQIKVRTVDARQWLLGVRQAALTTHDDIYRSLKPLLRGQQLSHSDRHYLAAVARDVVEQKGASMFVLLSAARFAETGDDDNDLNPLPDIENLDDLRGLRGVTVGPASAIEAVAADRAGAVAGPGEVAAAPARDVSRRPEHPGPEFRSARDETRPAAPLRAPAAKRLLVYNDNHAGVVV